MLETTLIIQGNPKGTADVPSESVGYLIDEKNGYTEEVAIKKFTEKYGVVPEKAVRWRCYLFIPHKLRR